MCKWLRAKAKRSYARRTWLGTQNARWQRERACQGSSIMEGTS